MSGAASSAWSAGGGARKRGMEHDDGGGSAAAARHVKRQRMLGGGAPSRTASGSKKVVTWQVREDSSLGSDRSKLTTVADTILGGLNISVQPPQVQVQRADASAAREPADGGTLSDGAWDGDGDDDFTVTIHREKNSSAVTSRRSPSRHRSSKIDITTLAAGCTFARDRLDRAMNRHAPESVDGECPAQSDHAWDADKESDFTITLLRRSKDRQQLVRGASWRQPNQSQAVRAPAAVESDHAWDADGDSDFTITLSRRLRTKQQQQQRRSPATLRVHNTHSNLVASRLQNPAFQRGDPAPPVVADDGYGAAHLEAQSDHASWDADRESDFTITLSRRLRDKQQQQLSPVSAMPLLVPPPRHRKPLDDARSSDGCDADDGDDDLTITLSRRLRTRPRPTSSAASAAFAAKQRTSPVRAKSVVRRVTPPTAAALRGLPRPEKTRGDSKADDARSSEACSASSATCPTKRLSPPNTKSTVRRVTPPTASATRPLPRPEKLRHRADDARSSDACDADDGEDDLTITLSRKVRRLRPSAAGMPSSAAASGPFTTKRTSPVRTKSTIRRVTPPTTAALRPLPRLEKARYPAPDDARSSEACSASSTTCPTKRLSPPNTKSTVRRVTPPTSSATRPLLRPEKLRHRADDARSSDACDADDGEDDLTITLSRKLRAKPPRERVEGTPSSSATAAFVGKRTSPARAKSNTRRVTPPTATAMRALPRLEKSRGAHGPDDARSSDACDGDDDFTVMIRRWGRAGGHPHVGPSGDAHSEDASWEADGDDDYTVMIRGGGGSEGRLTPRRQPLRRAACAAASAASEWSDAWDGDGEYDVTLMIRRSKRAPNPSKQFGDVPRRPWTQILNALSEASPCVLSGGNRAPAVQPRPQRTPVFDSDKGSDGEGPEGGPEDCAALQPRARPSPPATPHLHHNFFLTIKQKHKDRQRCGTTAGTDEATYELPEVSCRHPKVGWSDPWDGDGDDDFTLTIRRSKRNPKQYGVVPSRSVTHLGVGDPPHDNHDAGKNIPNVEHGLNIAGAMSNVSVESDVDASDDDFTLMIRRSTRVPKYFGAVPKRHAPRTESVSQEEEAQHVGGPGTGTVSNVSIASDVAVSDDDFTLMISRSKRGAGKRGGDGEREVPLWMMQDVNSCDGDGDDDITLMIRRSARKHAAQEDADGAAGRRAPLVDVQRAESFEPVPQVHQGLQIHEDRKRALHEDASWDGDGDDDITLMIRRSKRTGGGGGKRVPLKVTTTSAAAGAHDTRSCISTAALEGGGAAGGAGGGSRWWGAAGGPADGAEDITLRISRLKAAKKPHAQPPHDGPASDLVPNVSGTHAAPSPGVSTPTTIATSTRTPKTHHEDASWDGDGDDDFTVTIRRGKKRRTAEAAEPGKPRSLAVAAVRAEGESVSARCSYVGDLRQGVCVREKPRTHVSEDASWEADADNDAASASVPKARSQRVMSRDGTRFKPQAASWEAEGRGGDGAREAREREIPSRYPAVQAFLRAHNAYATPTKSQTGEPGGGSVGGGSVAKKSEGTRSNDGSATRSWMDVDVLSKISTAAEWSTTGTTMHGTSAPSDKSTRSVQGAVSMPSSDGEADDGDHAHDDDADIVDAGSSGTTGPHATPATTTHTAAATDASSSATGGESLGVVAPLRPRVLELASGVFYTPAPLRYPDAHPWARVLGGECDWERRHAAGTTWGWLCTASVDDIIERTKPWAVAQAYSGVQFGVWVPRLGDGRAATLCDVHDPRSGMRLEVSAKGCGKTAFARGFDGVMSVRAAACEYAAAGVIRGLGGPTAQVLALHCSDERCFREGRGFEKCAILLRAAPSWVRVGTLQFHAFHGDGKTAGRLIHWLASLTADAPATPHAWFAWFARRLGGMVGWWMAYGLYHGVLNTDNISVHGVTLDHSHCEFLAVLDDDHCTNATDENQMYAFGKQPGVLRDVVVRQAQQLASVGVDVGGNAAAEVFDGAYQRALCHHTLERCGVASVLLEEAGAVPADVLRVVEDFRGILREGKLAWWDVHARLVGGDESPLAAHPEWLRRFHEVAGAAGRGTPPARPPPTAPPALAAVPQLAAGERWGEIAAMVRAYDRRR